MMTIGHSTLPLDIFAAILQRHGVTTLIDVRSVPKSLHNPQFHRDVMSRRLPGEYGIAYHWMASLGGFRKTSPQSINLGWRNSSFRGFADYMQTPAFRDAIDELLSTYDHETTAIMCSEAVPWRCHRSLIADALVARGIAVQDIMHNNSGGSSLIPHRMTSFARICGSDVSYPEPDENKRTGE